VLGPALTETQDEESAQHERCTRIGGGERRFTRCLRASLLEQYRQERVAELCRDNLDEFIEYAEQENDLAAWAQTKVEEELADPDGQSEVDDYINRFVAKLLGARP
jgi:hypothetical protein